MIEHKVFILILDTEGTCIPLGKWLNMENDWMSIKTRTNEKFGRVLVELIAFCADEVDIAVYSWGNKGNLFAPDSNCYSCDLR